MPDSKSEMDYRLFGQLQHHFGVATSPEYRLRVNTDVASRDLAISGDRSITRYSLTATADFALEDVAGQIVLRDGVRAFTAYNATASAYATRVARRDAFERLAIALADKIFARISARAGELGA